MISLQQLLLVLICALSTMAEASDLTCAANLGGEAELANQQGKPLIILYSRQNCHYCEVVRRSYLQPLEKTAPNLSKLVIRQINIDRETPLVDFSGTKTTHAAFASQQKIKLVPVVAFYGPTGQSLAAPIIGTRIADFYQSYLDEAIHLSVRRLNEIANTP